MISAVVLTKNEEDRIRACLESLKWVDEIVVVDSGSTDGTLEIARKYTDKVLEVKSDDFSELRNKGMEKASGDWVLYVDSDERVLKELREEIGEIIREPKNSAYAISRINIIFGQRVSYGPYKKDWMIRLFKKADFEGWQGLVHEYGKFKGSLGYTKNSLIHLTHRNLDHFISKSLEWSKIDAKLRLDSGHPKMTKWRFLRILTTESFNQLFKRQGLFGGTVGVVDSVLQVFSFYITYVRLWEMQQPKPLDQLYKDIDQKLLENDFKY